MINPVVPILKGRRLDETMTEMQILADIGSWFYVDPNEAFRDAVKDGLIAKNGRNPFGKDVWVLTSHPSIWGPPAGGMAEAERMMAKTEWVMAEVEAYAKRPRVKLGRVETRRILHKGGPMNPMTLALKGNALLGEAMTEMQIIGEIGSWSDMEPHETFRHSVKEGLITKHGKDPSGKDLWILADEPPPKKRSAAEMAADDARSKKMMADIDAHARRPIAKLGHVGTEVLRERCLINPIVPVLKFRAVCGEAVTELQIFYEVGSWFGMEPYGLFHDAVKEGLIVKDGKNSSGDDLWVLPDYPPLKNPSVGDMADAKSMMAEAYAYAKKPAAKLGHVETKVLCKRGMVNPVVSILKYSARHAETMTEMQILAGVGSWSYVDPNEAFRDAIKGGLIVKDRKNPLGRDLWVLTDHPSVKESFAEDMTENEKMMAEYCGSPKRPTEAFGSTGTDALRGSGLSSPVVLILKCSAIYGEGMTKLQILTNIAAWFGMMPDEVFEDAVKGGLIVKDGKDTLGSDLWVLAGHPPPKKRTAAELEKDEIGDVTYANRTVAGAVHIGMKVLHESGLVNPVILTLGFSAIHGEAMTERQILTEIGSWFGMEPHEVFEDAVREGLAVKDGKDPFGKDLWVLADHIFKGMNRRDDDGG